jgi:hypothetical protein
MDAKIPPPERCVLFGGMDHVAQLLIYVGLPFRLVQTLVEMMLMVSG